MSLDRAAVGGFIAPLLFLLLAFSGCATKADEGALPRTRLADHLGCDEAYPDGVPVPCRNQATPLEAQDGPPAGWVCVDTYPPRSTGQPRYAFYRSQEPGLLGPMLGDRFGIQFFLESDPFDFHGALHLVSQEGEAFYNFSSKDPSPFLRLPEKLGDSVEFQFYVHYWHLASNVDALENATVRAVWSLYRNADSHWGHNFWQLTQLVTEGSTYYTFNAMKAWDSYGKITYFPQDATFQGEDFFLQMEEELALSLSSDGSLLTQPGQDC